MERRNRIEEDKEGYQSDISRRRNNDLYSPNINIDSENISNFSQSTPSEMSQMMMSSDEVRDIMNMYSASIENCHGEIDFFTQRVTELTKNRDRLVDQNNIARKELESMQDWIDKNNNEIDDLNEKVTKASEEYSEVSNTSDVDSAMKLVQSIEG